MFKFISALLFFFASSLLQQENYAAQIRNADVEHLAAAVQQAVTHFFSNFEPAGRNNHTNANQWMFFLLKQADDESSEHAFIAKIASLNDVTLTSELLSLADGFHLMIPNVELEVENEQRIEAIAITNMLMNLKTMERMDTIMANCSLYSTMNVLFNEANNESLTLDKEKFVERSRDYIGKLFSDWLRSLVAALENDPHLSEQFAAGKDEAMRAILTIGYPSLVSPPTSETESLQSEADASTLERKLAEKMFNSHLFRKMSLNRMFLRAASKQMVSHKTTDKTRRFLFARALLDLASQGGQDVKVNEIYRKTLAAATESASETNMMNEMRDGFFDALEKEINEDRDLARRIKSIETKLEIWIAFRAMRRSVAFI